MRQRLRVAEVENGGKQRCEAETKKRDREKEGEGKEWMERSM